MISPRQPGQALLAISLVAALLAWAPASSRSEEQGAWQYVEQVLLGKGSVVRWTEPARLYVRGADESELRQMQDVLRAINGTLGGTKMQVSGPLADTIDYDHAVVVNLQPESFFLRTPITAIRQIENPLPDTAGRTRTDAPAGIINFSSILVRQGLPLDSTVRTMLHELLHALGLVGHAEGNTVMAASISPGRELTALTPLDRKALRFLYLHLQPGDGPAEVRRAFDAHWRSIPDS